MNLRLVRSEFTDKSTIGELFVNGSPECYTLEDRVRPVKIKGSSAIPAGAYEVIINFSDRFQQPMPLLINVPNFDGVRMHWGNTEKDTEGCILVGKTKDKDFVGESRKAFEELFAKMQTAAKSGKIRIEIVEEQDPGGIGT